MHAARVLVDEQSFWFLDDGRRVFKQGVLEALGRLGNPETIRKVARALAKKEITTRSAQARIRRGRSRGGNLVRAVQWVVDEYRERYPEATAHEIMHALDTVAERYRKPPGPRP